MERKLMTVEAPPALQATPRTTSGTGLTVPIAKALAHLWLVHEATAREWPITAEQASAEIAEAVTHLRDIIYPEDLLTETLVSELATWNPTLTTFAATAAAEAVSSPEEPFSADHAEDLRSIVRGTWALLALIDREITGLELQADPGSMP